ASAGPYCLPARSLRFPALFFMKHTLGSHKPKKGKDFGKTPLWVAQTDPVSRQYHLFTSPVRRSICQHCQQLGECVASLQDSPRNLCGQPAMPKISDKTYCV